MKRLFSWIVLIVLDFIAVYLTNCVANLVIALGRTLHDKNPALFWWIILGEGFLAIVLLAVFAMVIPTYVVKASEYFYKSANGLRYKVLGFSVAIIYFIDLIYGLSTKTYKRAFEFVVNTLIYIIFNLALVVFWNVEKEEREKNKPTLDRTNVNE